MQKQVMRRKNISVISPHPVIFKEKLPSGENILRHKTASWNELLKILESKKWTVDQCPAWGMPVGSEVIDLLYRIAHEGSTEVRIEVAKAFGQIRDEKAYGALQRMLKYEVNVGARFDESALKRQILKSLEQHKKPILVWGKRCYAPYVK